MWQQKSFFCYVVLLWLNWSLSWSYNFGLGLDLILLVLDLTFWSCFHHCQFVPRRCGRPHCCSCSSIASSLSSSSPRHSTWLYFWNSLLTAVRHHQAASGVAVPGRPRNKWVDQVWSDNNLPAADLWRHAVSRGHLGVMLWPLSAKR